MPQFLVSDSAALGALLRGVRKARGLTQAELAQRAGLLPKTVCALESGTGQVLVRTLLRCLSALQAEMLIAPTEDAGRGSWTAAPGALTELVKRTRKVATDSSGRATVANKGSKPPTTGFKFAAKASSVPRSTRPAKALKERW